MWCVKKKVFFSVRYLSLSVYFFFGCCDHANSAICCCVTLSRTHHASTSLPNLPESSPFPFPFPSPTTKYNKHKTPFFFFLL